MAVSDNVVIFAPQNEIAMKRISLFACVLLAVLLTGCAPRVATDLASHEWPATSPDSVYVFHINERVPQGAQVIGKVKVVDTGFSVGGSYERVMQLAVNATAKNGGNGLKITEHHWPDRHSTIHRVWGDMLRIPESALAESEEPDTMEYSALQQVLPTEEYAEFMEYKAAKQRYEEDRRAFEEQMRKMDEAAKNAPHNIFRLSAGPSLMTSKYQVGNHLYKSRFGFDICADYDHVWKSGFGFGINYRHNYTSFNEGIKMRLDYVGPSVVMATPTMNTIRLDLAFGLGYCHYGESYANQTYTQNRMAVTMRVGAELKVARHLALGAQLSAFTMSMKKPENIELKKDEFYGIEQVGLQVGLRHYF